MGSPEYVVQLIVQGKDEASQTLRAVYGEMKKGNETIGQARDRMNEARLQMREMERVQRTAIKSWEEHNRVVLEGAKLFGEVGNMGRSVMRMYEQYTMMSLRLERAQRDLADAQQDLTKAQQDYLSTLYEFGPRSKETEDALDRLKQAQERVADAEKKVAEISRQNQIAMIGMGMASMQLVSHISSLVIQYQRLKIAIATASVETGGMATASAAAGGGISFLTAALTKLGTGLTVAAGVAGGVFAVFAFGPSTVGATAKSADELANTFQLLDLQMIANQKTTLKGKDALISYAESLDWSRAEEMTMIRVLEESNEVRGKFPELTREQYNAEIEWGRGTGIAVEYVKRLIAANKDEAQIVEKLVDLGFKERAATDLVRIAMQEELKAKIENFKATGVLAEDAIKEIEKYTDSYLAARDMVVGVYGSIKTAAEVAAEAQIKAFQDAAAQLPQFLQGFDMGERSIAGMAEEARTKFHQIADVISQVTGAQVQLVPSEWFAEVIKSMGIDVGDFRKYSEEQLSELYAMMQSNPALTAYVWKRTMQTMGTDAMPVILEMGQGVEQLTKSWNDASQAVRDYISEVEKTGGGAPAFEPGYLQRLGGIQTPELPAVVSQKEQQPISQRIEKLEQLITIGPFYVSKEVDVDNVSQTILRKLADIIKYLPRGVA